MSTPALLRLLDAGAQSVVEALGEPSGAPLVRGEPRVSRAPEALSALPLPVVMARTPVAGGTACLVLTLAAARALGIGPTSEGAPESEADEIATGVRGVLERALGALAKSTEALLEIAPGDRSVPDVKVVREWSSDISLDPDEPVGTVDVEIGGESALLLLDVSATSLERLGAGASADVDDPEGLPPGPVISDAALRPVHVRLWAELGRARMPLGRAVALSPGAVVELDAGVEDPVDILVNGIRLGRGKLVVSDDGSWALRVDEIVAEPGVRAR